MGHKVHPVGFRLGINKTWQAKWYSDKHYKELVLEDLAIRKALNSKYADAGMSTIEIERDANDVTVTIHTSRPGVVIGRGGQRVDESRLFLEKLTGRRIRLNIQEIREPEVDAYLVAKSIAEQLTRRVSRRRAVRQAISRAMQRGTLGVKVAVAGRIGGALIARREVEREGRVPLHTLRADIDYGIAEAHTVVGVVGVKVWIYKGDILPEPKESAEEVETFVASEEIEDASTEASEISESTPGTP